MIVGVCCLLSLLVLQACESVTLITVPYEVEDSYVGMDPESVQQIIY